MEYQTSSTRRNGVASTGGKASPCELTRTKGMKGVKRERRTRGKGQKKMEKGRDKSCGDVVLKEVVRSNQG